MQRTHLVSERHLLTTLNRVLPAPKAGSTRYPPEHQLGLNSSSGPVRIERRDISPVNPGTSFGLGRRVYQSHNARTSPFPDPLDIRQALDEAIASHSTADRTPAPEVTA
jgi:hypothetical protein